MICYVHLALGWSSVLPSSYYLLNGKYVFVAVWLYMLFDGLSILHLLLRITTSKICWNYVPLWSSQRERNEKMQTCHVCHPKHFFVLNLLLCLHFNLMLNVIIGRSLINIYKLKTFHCKFARYMMILIPMFSMVSMVLLVLLNKIFYI